MYDRLVEVRRGVTFTKKGEVESTTFTYAIGVELAQGDSVDEAKDRAKDVIAAWMSQDKFSDSNPLTASADALTAPNPPLEFKASEKFPPELRAMLLFQVEGDKVIIKPRSYLGTENFAKVARIVKENDGNYISMGKESHFKIPLFEEEK